MKIALYGTGYVGLVTGACLAEVGNEVTCIDVDVDRIAGLKLGRMPFHEPGLAELVVRNQAAGKLDFTTHAASALAPATVIFIAVGTPPAADGSADLSQVLAVARSIGKYLTHRAVVVIKSTVPVGTADRVQVEIARAITARGAMVLFDVVANPEFLKEGEAVEDCLRPERILLGSQSRRAISVLRALYTPFNRNHERVLEMDTRSAELTKYAGNAMLATKISLMNEMANIAERVGADIEQVRRGIGADPRIGHHFIYAGAGYGGSCFPKDVQALARAALAQGYEPRILAAVEAVNSAQKNKLFELVARHFHGRLAGRTVALWGLSFKPDTDDMREAPSLALMQSLWDEGACVRAYDPQAGSQARECCGERADLVICESPYQALDGADVLVVVTEWKLFRSPDFARIRLALKEPAIFDGRNLYEPAEVEAAGLAYYGIGRGRSLLVLPVSTAPLPAANVYATYAGRPASTVAATMV
ncbi:UDP-glucose dehydrogenase family protein [Dyella thiooxydans]|nr:UDP-glucose/GDP-mannose dehydrogenase family protein [Dyella thiooxydans]